MKFAQKLLILCVVCLAAIFILNILPIHGEEEIYNSVVRFHVLANSDTEEDQALKLKVRDEVLLLTAPVLKDCSSREDAQKVLSELIPQIKSCAEQVVSAEGYSYSVDVRIDEEYYPTKEYESCSFPEGKYTSLRIIIGKGEGQNWWCCLFPPLCLSSATSQAENEDAFISVGLTGDQYKVITQTDTPKYKVRFKILEVFQRTFG